MNVNKLIKPKSEVKPSIYAYTTPTNTEKQGWIKIGYTERDVDVRIKEQTHTVGIRAEKLWNHPARFLSGGWFKDHQFHSYLTLKGVEKEHDTEWFFFNDHPEEALGHYKDFVFKDYSEFQTSEKSVYVLRDEQQKAVDMTYDYFMNNPGLEFLWNAKPRFGKTLSTYDLVKRMDVDDVLIVTNRPAIANSWFDDFQKFISWNTDYKFVSESESLADRSTFTRGQIQDMMLEEDNVKQIVFISLQDLKGSRYLGGEYEKLDWVPDVNWDLLIIDEAHEGVDTSKTDRVFDYIKRKNTLHLSGTPFKAIASGKFSEEAIYNWSYADEQEAKLNWDREEHSPYEELPKLNMFTYEMSKMLVDKVNKGALIDEEEKEYAFDLNEFFATKDNGRFIYEKDVAKWLDTLTTNEKYPFSTEELRDELRHTFWVMHRVASVKALERMLKRHDVFKDYEIIIAAGDGKSEEDEVITKRSLDRVRDAIKNNERTITLSVGQLTTGVTIPEWSAVLMLNNIKSPALYMQAAFRAQNPHQWEENVDGKEVVYRKDNAYVFDFAPERTLILFDEFANNLISETTRGGGTTEDREENIKRLLNFFPVIGEDEEGRMVELDASSVLTIPKMIKANEVVRRGFMSNLLFANISGIFSAPQVALDILDKLKEEEQGRLREPKANVDLGDVEVDKDGEAKVEDGHVINQTEAIFGQKIYKPDISLEELEEDSSTSTQNRLVRSTAKSITAEIEETGAFDKFKEDYDLSNAAVDKIKKDFENSISNTAEDASVNLNIEKANIEKEYKTKMEKAKSTEEVKELETEFKDTIKESVDKFTEGLNKEIEQVVEEIKHKKIEEQEKRIENRKKNEVEEGVRSRLRGFARTIPSFIMAYGEEDLRLDNFDTYIPDDVFEEVTGITVDQFRFLRDGGPYEENGETKHYEGNVFDEIVFNQSILEFLNKRRELSNYFEDQEEDIFDYIPPQETNQIYTPKNVVKMMVDELEKENPGIYDDSSKTFIDIYMKSGLYITEIVKRLYNSEIIKEEYPDDFDRLKHILENQVYGFAPSEIIYQIAVNFIFGEYQNIIDKKNFIQEDTTPFVKENKLQDLIDKKFGS